MDGKELSEHEKAEKSVTPAVRAEVLERDNYQCRVCGSTNGVQLHHWVYRSLGGTHIPANLITVCFRCHRLIHDGLISVELKQVDNSWQAFVQRYKFGRRQA